MLTLAATNTLAGSASASSTVTITVMGMELVGTTETYKVLHQSQLPAAAATLYTVPASTTAFVRSIKVVNTDVVNNEQFQLFSNGTAIANAITPLVTIPPGGMAVYEDGQGWKMYTSTMQEMVSIYNTSPQEVNFGISGSKGETINRTLCAEVNTTGPASGTLWLQAIWLTAGTVVSNINMHSATTAAGTPTNYAAGLYDINRNLLASSANQTTSAWGANSLKTFAMQTPYTVPTTGLYYIGYYMTATTVPTYKGGTGKTGGQLAAQTPILHGTSTTGLTTSLPNPAAVINGSTATIWASVT